MESLKLFMTSTHLFSLVRLEACILCLIFQITLAMCQDSWKAGRLLSLPAGTGRAPWRLEFLIPFFDPVS